MVAIKLYRQPVVEAIEEEDEEPKAITLDNFTPDCICTKCGRWRTEHLWEICKVPNWLD